MGRWIVVEDDQELVIETAPDGRISLSIPSGGPVVVDIDGAQEIRTKLGAAIASSGPDVRP